MRSALENFGGDRPLPPAAELRGSIDGADCANCPFAVDGRAVRPVFGEGARDPAWILIGEGPGVNEKILGRPFVGASGAVMDKALYTIGRSRKEIWVTNSHCCLPFEGADERVRDRASAACRPRLLSELARFPGKPILTVGAPAARVILPGVFDQSAKKPKKAQATDVVAVPLAVIQTTIEANLAQYGNKSRAEIDRERKALALERRRATLAAKKLAAAQGITLPPAAKRAKGTKAPKIPKVKPPKVRRAKGRTKNKGLTFSDVVSTLHVSLVTGEERLVIPTIHPAAILRSGAKPLKGAHSGDLAYWNLLYDAGKLDALARGRDIKFKEDIDIEVSDSARATRLILDIVDEAFAAGECALDLETYVLDEQRHHALMMYVAQIKSIGLATPTRGVSVMWHLLGPLAHAAIRRLLSSPDVVMGFHNGLYDRTVLRARGFELVDKWSDTLLAHHATFPGAAHKLQFVAGQFFAIRPWKSEFRDGDETPEALTTYNCLDTLTTARLRAPLEILIKKTKTEKVYEMDLCMSTIASHMHLWGVPISRDVNQELLTGFRKNVDEAKAQINEVANDPEILERIKHYICMEEAHTIRKSDPDDYRARHAIRVAKMNEKIGARKWSWGVDKSTHVVGLLRALGVNLTTMTASGRTSTAKGILENLVDVPIVRRIVNYRENAKLLSTFVWSLFDRPLADGSTFYGFADENDRVHPSWSVTKISGRWASTEPVLSNVPKDDKKKGRPNLRKQVVAPKGRTFVGFDFCLAVGTLVATPAGDRPIEDLRTGDAIISFNRATRRADRSQVSATLSTGIQATLKVVLDTGAEVRCTPNHRWLTLPQGAAGFDVETEARDLQPGTMLVSRHGPCAVAAIIDDGLVVPTYDIEVERDHNFALAAGVFVHNSQIEGRVIGLVSGDPWLCKIFADGRDLHTEAMKIVWGPDIAKMKEADPKLFKLLRDAVKRFEYGAFYGGSVETLWKTLLKDDANVKFADVQAAVYKLMGAMPNVVAWQDQSVITASKPPNEIRSVVLGRRRVFPLVADRNEAINIAVQSTAADIMNTGMWRMWQRLPKYRGTCFPILQIHDATVFECDEDDADRVQQDVKECFPQEYTAGDITVPFPIETDIAQDWAGV